MNPRGKYGAWGPRRPMKTPVLYRRYDTVSNGTTQRALANAAVLWDAQTGQAYVHRPGG